LDDEGTKIGYVLAVTSKEGYAGAISLTFGVNNDRMLTGMEILSMSETPGLGANAAQEGFTSQFRDIKAQELTVTKKGKQTEQEIDIISGATITTDAVVGAINAGISLIEFIED
jgi:electron transport complex protein RnfG